MDDNEPESGSVFSLLDLPPELIYSIAEALWDSPVALINLSRTCSHINSIIQDQQLWQAVATQRYGSELLPAGPGSCPNIPGWVFLQGLQWAKGNNGTGEHVPLPRGSPPEEVARAALGIQDAVAFDHEGTVYTTRVSPQQCTYAGYEPWAGTWVRQYYPLLDSFRAAFPDSTLTNAGPPALPGFTFYPGLDSPGSDTLWPPGDNTCACNTHRTLEALAAFANGDSSVVAFNTRGNVKVNLAPTEQWVDLRHTWHGLYVKAAAKERMQLPEPPGAPKWREIYIRHARLRKSLASGNDASVTWLNDQYLTREPGDAGAWSPLVVQLHHVCWLELSVHWPGVTPGRYRLVWRVQARSPPHWLHGPGFTPTITAALCGARAADGQVVGPLSLPDPRLIHEAVAAGIDRTPAGPGAAAASTAGQPPQGQAGSHVHNQWQPRYRGLAYMSPATPGRDASGQPASLMLLKHMYSNDMRRLLAQHSTQWFSIEVGEIEVPPGYVYSLTSRFQETGGHWKHGCAWDYAELVPLTPESQASEIPRRRPHQQQQQQQQAHAAAPAPPQAPGHPGGPGADNAVQPGGCIIA